MCLTNEGLIIWQTIDTAPKPPDDGPDQFKEIWILGANCHEIRVIRWTTEYPSKGKWMFAYAPNDYIDGIQTFHPTHWMPLPSPPQ